MQKKLLWVGDAVVSSGFARATHHILNTVREQWGVEVLGINYLGDPHAHPYPIFPCYPGGDAFGVKRVRNLVEARKPDLIVIQQDPWNFPAYLKELKGLRTPVVGAVAVDGKNCRGKALEGLAHAIFWTKFGEEEARAGGWTGPSSVIPLGVDLRVYRPLTHELARKELGLDQKLPSDAFIVGNVNRNQPRKRLDLTVEYFCRWVAEHDVRNAYLYLHVAPTGDRGYDLAQLAHYYGLQKRLILATPEIGYGVTEESMALVYNSFSLQVSTTQGEGWGLTHQEGMACGAPQIAPDWSALGEWGAEGAMQLIPCPTTSVTPDKINVVGGVPDREAFVEALQAIYCDPQRLTLLAQRGYRKVLQPEYRWENIGRRYLEVLEQVPLP
jgi:D-inositol-3-phosphate glycosyltransferase